LTITPPPAVLNKGCASFTAKNTELKFEAITVFHSSIDVSSRGLETWTAALFTNTLSRSVNARACENMASILSAMETSDWMNNPLAGKLSPNSARSTPITRQADREKRATVALPIPPAAPVIRTVRCDFADWSIIFVP